MDPARRHARRARRAAGHRRRRARADHSSAGTSICAEGHDPDFGRGDSAFDCWWGDPTARAGGTPRSGRSTSGPYYAFEIHSGTLGTKGGPRVDPDARVLDLDGEPIPGLYAAGNVMGSPFGMTYGGPGGTLGPAMVFGYLAGRHAAAARA